METRIFLKARQQLVCVASPSLEQADSDLFFKETLRRPPRVESSDLDGSIVLSPALFSKTLPAESLNLPS
ncbi:mCG1035908 [Mus musculus]|jgi:hypothetical protein|nr:mCG1035908 [Mus musculus]